MVPVTAVDPSHERLDERLVRFTTEPASDEGGDRLVAVGRRRRDLRLGSKPLLPRIREERALVQGAEVRRDNRRQPFRQQMQLVAPAHEGASVLGSSPDEVVLEPELLTETDAALLARQEAVGCALDQESANARGHELPAQPARAFDECDLR